MLNIKLTINSRSAHQTLISYLIIVGRMNENKIININIKSILIYLIEGDFLHYPLISINGASNCDISNYIIIVHSRL